MQYAGFNTLPIHNHVYSFGEWSWIIGSLETPSADLKQRIRNIDLSELDELKWLNRDALEMMTAFGQDLVTVDTSKIEINS